MTLLIAFTGIVFMGICAASSFRKASDERNWQAFAVGCIEISVALLIIYL